ncbi:UDP- glucuronosyltransferase [Rhodocaloribacter litoris]|uniref:glycosyltransferase family protein n=1 Tax=Rhodocaloribacter litoris TaxID=2558931 RepID=UPI00141DF9BC|nr:glycosyltransferase family protein [Rhodocaloribacter litoris]QXD16910.1 UDP- glucuronosyltransferase [Rhodocaloribacter litoris]GIV60579.1 MAG: glycosyl transferase [Rhodothermaceae bacterium]
MDSLNCLFVVQGEGRGHLTQALALRALLRKAGHTVGGVLVGRNAQRTLPRFFLDKIDAPVSCFDSPNFAFDAHRRGIRTGATVWQNLCRLPGFRAGLEHIHRTVQRLRPDVILNFFEPLVALYTRLYRPGVPVVCIGHQYMFHHPAYPFPPGRAVQRSLARHYTDLTAAGAARRLALSFYPAEDLPARRLKVMPPLLRPELFRQPDGLEEPFFLIYVLNSGYAEAIVRWHERRKDVRLHCFWDRPDADEVLHYDDTLTFHRLDDEKFLALMARCRGLVCTAGFESVCEAMYLGKPVLMVPVEGHFEQYCNARDAEAAGAGRYSPHFDLDRLLDFLPHYRRVAPHFRPWVAEAEARFLEEIEAVAGKVAVPA